MGKLEGKTALITGGNSGIGLATAEVLLLGEMVDAHEAEKRQPQFLGR